MGHEPFHWLPKEARIKRNKLILDLRERGLPIKQIATHTNLAPRGVEEVLYIEKRRKRR